MQIEQYKCENKRELETRERYWLEELKATLNICVPSRTNKEYHEANKEHYKEYSKEYYEANKQQIKEKNKEHYETNKQQIKEKRKEYYENNKEKIKEYQKEYCEENKEKIQEMASKKNTCDLCGGYYTNNHKLRHIKTKKHQRSLM